MKSAILIPIHAGHSARFIALINNLERIAMDDCQLIFIATDKQEKFQFANYIGARIRNIHVINAMQIAAQTHNNAIRAISNANVTKGIINLKKFLGLIAVFPWVLTMQLSLIAMYFF